MISDSATIAPGTKPNPESIHQRLGERQRAYLTQAPRTPAGWRGGGGQRR
jgi:hypothetical protein